MIAAIIIGIVLVVAAIVSLSIQLKQYKEQANFFFKEMRKVEEENREYSFELIHRRPSKSQLKPKTKVKIIPTLNSKIRLSKLEGVIDSQLFTEDNKYRVKFGKDKQYLETFDIKNIMLR